MEKIFKKMVSKVDFKPALTKVQITSTDITATNSFSLLNVKNEALSSEEMIKKEILVSRIPEGKEYVLVNPENLKLEGKLLSLVEIDTENSFPEWKAIVPSDEKQEKEYTSIKIDVERLMEVAEAIKNSYTKGVKVKSVNLKVPKISSYPVLIERTDRNAFALIMPLNL